MPRDVRRRLLRLAAIATAAGAFSGLFGVGGGTIIVPLLVLWLGYEQKEATGTSLAAIIVIGSLAAGTQAIYGNVDLWLGLAIGVPGVIGVVAGTALQQRLSERAVAGAFVVLLVASAAVLDLLMDASTGAGLIALGLAAGMAGGLVGVGGGVMFVPALVVFADESQLGAEATSLVAIVLVSVVGTWRQRGYGNVRLRDGLIDRGAVAARRAGRRGPGQRGSRAGAGAGVRRRCSSFLPGNSPRRRDSARLQRRWRSST